MNCQRCDNKGKVKQYNPRTKRFEVIICPSCNGTSAKKPANE